MTREIITWDPVQRANISTFVEVPDETSVPVPVIVVDPPPQPTPAPLPNGEVITWDPIQRAYISSFPGQEAAPALPTAYARPPAPAARTLPRITSGEQARAVPAQAPAIVIDGTSQAEGSRIAAGEFINISEQPRQTAPITGGQEVHTGEPPTPYVPLPSSAARISEGEIINIGEQPRTTQPIAGGEEIHAATQEPVIVVEPPEELYWVQRNFQTNQPSEPTNIAPVADSEGALPQEGIETPTLTEPVIVVEPIVAHSEGALPEQAIETPTLPEPAIVLDEQPATSTETATEAPAGNAVSTTPSDAPADEAAATPDDTGAIPNEPATAPLWPDLAQELQQLFAYVPEPVRAVAESVKQAAEHVPWWVWPAAGFALLALTGQPKGKRR